MTAIEKSKNLIKKMREMEFRYVHMMFMIVHERLVVDINEIKITRSTNSLRKRSTQSLCNATGRVQCVVYNLSSDLITVDVFFDAVYSSTDRSQLRPRAHFTQNVKITTCPTRAYAGKVISFDTDRRKL